jgi:hypothetical protein
MLKALSCSNAQRLREFLAEAHYTQDEFQKTKGVQEFPKLAAGNLPHLLHHFPETSALNLLLRWFYLGVPVEPGLAASFVPEPVLALMEECGMLVHQGSLLSPTVALVPCDHYVFAADTSARMQKQPADVVIWPNPTSRLLYQFTMRRPVRTTLDLGAGCGIQAVMAASHSTQVTRAERRRKYRALHRGYFRYHRKSRIRPDRGQPAVFRHPVRRSDLLRKQHGTGWILPARSA